IDSGASTLAFAQSTGILAVNVSSFTSPPLMSAGEKASEGGSLSMASWASPELEGRRSLLPTRSRPEDRAAAAERPVFPGSVDGNDDVRTRTWGYIPGFRLHPRAAAIGANVCVRLDHEGFISRVGEHEGLRDDLAGPHLPVVMPVNSFRLAGQGGHFARCRRNRRPICTAGGGEQEQPQDNPRTAEPRIVYLGGGGNNAVGSDMATIPRTVEVLS